MWGNDDKGRPHIFVENKFWAGLTSNQPISYLQILAKQSHPTLLLMVVPQKREQAVWGELNRRLVKAQISTTNPRISPGVVYCVTTSLGPLLALTSWNKLLSFLGDETKDDLAVSSDLLQSGNALAQATPSPTPSPSKRQAPSREKSRSMGNPATRNSYQNTATRFLAIPRHTT
jgi:hypothetical protein